MCQRHEGGVPSGQQRAHALRTTQLVAGDGHQVEPAPGEVDLDVADRLDSITVHRDVELVRHGGDLGDRLHRADLVVGPHHADERDRFGVGLDSRTHRLGVDTTNVVDLEPGDLGALVGLEEVDTVQDGVVLDRADQESHSSGIGVPTRPEGALDRQVVGLGAAGGEDHLRRAGAQGLGNRLAGLLDDAPSNAPGGVQGGGVADHGHLRGHRLDRLGQHRRGRRMVEVDKGVAHQPSLRGSAATPDNTMWPPEVPSLRPSNRQSCPGGARPSVATAGSRGIACLTADPLSVRTYAPFP